MLIKRLALVIAATLWIGASVKAADSGAQGSSCKPADEAAIRALAGEFDAAWTAKSASRYAATFSEDADWENAFGGRKRGRKEIEEIATGLLSNSLASAQETLTDTRISCIQPNVALVDLYQTISGQRSNTGNLLADRHIRMSQIYLKRDGKWQIRVHRVADLRGFQNR
jgi:uncharacterized protein (TIGR02246 family)